MRRHCWWSRVQNDTLICFTFITIWQIVWHSFIGCCAHCCGLQMSHVSFDFPQLSLSDRNVLSQSILLYSRPMFVLVSLLSVWHWNVLKCNIIVLYVSSLKLRGFAKLKNSKNPKKNLDRAHPTHPPPTQTFFGNPSLTWTEHSNHNN